MAQRMTTSEGTCAGEWRGSGRTPRDSFGLSHGVDSAGDPSLPPFLGNASETVKASPDCTHNPKEAALAEAARSSKRKGQSTGLRVKFHLRYVNISSADDVIQGDP